MTSHDVGSGVEAEILLGDMAYSDGDVREAVEEHGVELVAKVPPVTNSGRFPETDFIIDNDKGEVTCPAGNTTRDARKVKDHKGRRAVVYLLDREMCASCPCATSAPRRTRAARSSWAATTTASRKPAKPRART